MVRLFLAVIGACMWFGCSEAPRQSLPEDAGRDAQTEDRFVPNDGGDDGGDGGDGGGDGGDGGGDAGDGGDGGEPARVDCTTSPGCPSCPFAEKICDDDNPCDNTGEVCLSTGCDDFKRCFIIGGGGCDGPEDCPDPNYECDPDIFRCLRTTPGCSTSIDCVKGYACESGACVDRRVPCEELADCPHGYVCRLVDDGDQQFCRRITKPCERDLDCLELGVGCGDADDDDNKECMASQNPNPDPGDGGVGPDAGPDPVVACANSDCTDIASPVCEMTVEGTRAVCGRFGLCQDAGDCAALFECLDLWGDGRKECVPLSGSCGASSECTSPQVCASNRAGDPPACQVGAGT